MRFKQPTKVKQPFAHLTYHPKLNEKERSTLIPSKISFGKCVTGSKPGQFKVGPSSSLRQT